MNVALELNAETYSGVHDSLRHHWTELNHWKINHINLTIKGSYHYFHEIVEICFFRNVIAKNASRFRNWAMSANPWWMIMSSFHMFLNAHKAHCDHRNLVTVLYMLLLNSYLRYHVAERVGECMAAIIPAQLFECACWTWSTMAKQYISAATRNNSGCGHINNVRSVCKDRKELENQTIISGANNILVLWGRRIQNLLNNF